MTKAIYGTKGIYGVFKYKRKAFLLIDTSRFLLSYHLTSTHSMPSQSTPARRLSPPVIYVAQPGWVRHGGLSTPFVLKITTAQSFRHPTFNFNPNKEQTTAWCGFEFICRSGPGILGQAHLRGRS